MVQLLSTPLSLVTSDYTDAHDKRCDGGEELGCHFAVSVSEPSFSLSTLMPRVHCRFAAPGSADSPFDLLLSARTLLILAKVSSVLLRLNRRRNKRTCILIITFP